MCPVGYRLTAAVALLSIIIADEPGEKFVLTSLLMHPYLSKKTKKQTQYDFFSYFFQIVYVMSADKGHASDGRVFLRFRQTRWFSSGGQLCNDCLLLTRDVS